MVGDDPLCGGIGFKLVNETHQALLELNSGVVTVQTVTEKEWIGEHVVQFEVYMIDIDSNALYPLKLTESSLTLTIEDSILIDPVVKDWIIGNLIREAPVSLTPIIPLYSAFYNETIEY